MTGIVLYINILKDIKVFSPRLLYLFIVFSNRDINGLMDRGSYTPEARSRSDTPPCAADSGQDMAAGLPPGGRGDLLVIGRITSGWLISYQGSQQKLAEGDVPHRPFDENNH